MSAYPHGYFLRTSAKANRLSPYRLAGPRRAHPGVVFPRCPGCAVALSPIFRLDFDDERLAELGLWSGPLVALHCHNRCVPADGTWWWDYADALAPVLVDPEGVKADQAPAEDWEFEEAGVKLVDRVAPDPSMMEVESRVGGQPAWLQLEAPHDCRRCGEEMPMLVQWSEAGMQHIPTRTDGSGMILGNPFVRWWFGCQACRLVSSFEQLD